MFCSPFDFKFFNFCKFLLKDFFLKRILSELTFALQFSTLKKLVLCSKCDGPWLASSVLNLVNSIFEDIVLMLSK